MYVLQDNLTQAGIKRKEPSCKNIAIDYISAFSANICKGD
ncbi:hypothetical protein TR2A62_0791 [Thalassobium sp. R2A62]|nr:hypothetical protein TR2A62_0791 [Thalassobium sp. R2A62]